MIPKRIIAAAAVAAAALVSAGVTQPAFAAAGGPKTTFGAPHAEAASTVSGPGGAAAGSIWKVEATVNPQGMAPNPTDSTLTSVSATGPGEAWAAGTFMDQKALDHPLAEHRSGSTWTRVPVPQPAGQQALLNAVDDLSPGNAWAVGTSFSGGVAATPGGPTLIEHWNGTRWSIVPSPNPATGIPGDTDVLTAISGTGPERPVGRRLGQQCGERHDLAAVRALERHHLDGGHLPDPAQSAQFATAITAISPGNVWAVGTDETHGSNTLSAHWNGTAWSIVPTPNLTHAGNAQNMLTGVSSDSAGDVWASGLADNVNGQNLRVPYVLHWTGTQWVMTKVPNLGTEGSRLNGIQVLSPTDAWIVGQTQQSNGAILTLTERYNGSAWTIVPSPDPGRSRTGPTTPSTRSPPPGPATCSPSASGRPPARPSSAPSPSPPRKDELSPVNPAGPAPPGFHGPPAFEPRQVRLPYVGLADCSTAARNATNASATAPGARLGR